MKISRIAVAIVFTVFTAFSAYVTWKEGYLGAFPPFADLWTTQIFYDLAISLNIVLFLIYRDLKRRRQALWPVLACAVGVVLAGSIAPMLFLLLRKDFHETV